MTTRPRLNSSNKSFPRLSSTADSTALRRGHSGAPARMRRLGRTAAASALDGCTRGSVGQRQAGDGAADSAAECRRRCPSRRRHPSHCARTAESGADRVLCTGAAVSAPRALVFTSQQGGSTVNTVPLRNLSGLGGREGFYFRHILT